MDKVALIYPGQGSHSHDMFEGLLGIPSLKPVYDAAAKAFGIPPPVFKDYLRKADLSRTDNAQIAIYFRNHLLTLLLREQEPALKPDAAAGYSLGTYNAASTANALRLEDAISILIPRGRLMNEVSEAVGGGLVALIGGNPYGRIKEVEDNLKKKYGVHLSAVNSHDHITIGGPKDGLSKAVAFFDGRTTAINLKGVQGPFHTPHMKPVVGGLQPALDSVQYTDPEFSIIANTTGKVLQYKHEIKPELVGHLTMPIMWKDTLDTLDEMGIKVYIVIGDKANNGRSSSTAKMIKQKNPKAEVIDVNNYTLGLL